MRYELHPEAALEHEKQVAYYEELRRGLGRRYHTTMLRAVGKACEAPARFRVAYPPDIRKVALQGFRFNLIYREVNGMVQVLAVAHYRRKPNYWAGRV